MGSTTLIAIEGQAMIVADSSVWIDFFKGKFTPATARFSEALTGQDLLVGDLIACEVLKGARTDKHARVFELTMRKTVDLLIGAYCIIHRHALLHADRDFEPMQRYLGLKVVPTHYMVNEPRLAYG